MPDPIKFHLDENVDHAVAFGLKARGIDCGMQTRSIDELVRHLTLIHACLGAEEMHNAIEFC